MDSQAVVVADIAGHIQLWSRGAETLFGVSAAVALGQPLDLIIPEEYRDAHAACFRNAMGTSQAKIEGHPFDLPVQSPHGVVAVRGVLTLMRDPDKTVIGAMAVLTLPAAPAGA